MHLLILLFVVWFFIVCWSYIFWAFFIHSTFPFPGFSWFTKASPRITLQCALHTQQGILTWNVCKLSEKKTGFQTEVRGKSRRLFGLTRLLLGNLCFCCSYVWDCLCACLALLSFLCGSLVQYTSILQEEIVFIFYLVKYIE